MRGAQKLGPLSLTGLVAGFSTKNQGASFQVPDNMSMLNICIPNPMGPCSCMYISGL